MNILNAIFAPILALALWLSMLSFIIKFCAWLYPLGIAFADWWCGVLAWPFVAVWGLL